MTTTMTGDEQAVADRIRACREEQAALDDAEHTDPMRAATDMGAWHRRRAERDQRRMELEATTRDLEEWGLLIDSHREQVNAYTGAVRPLASRYRDAVLHRTWDDAKGRPSGARTAVIDWFRALTAFSRALDQDDPNVRRVLAREVEQWFRFRDGAVMAELSHYGGLGRFPAPELEDGGLPPWLRWGVHRLDREMPA